MWSTRASETEAQLSYAGLGDLAASRSRRANVVAMHGKSEPLLRHPDRSLRKRPTNPSPPKETVLNQPVSFPDRDTKVQLTTSWNATLAFRWSLSLVSVTDVKGQLAPLGATVPKLVPALMVAVPLSL